MLLEINNLEKSYGLQTAVSVKRLVLGAHDKVAVVGKNGAGKTTLLRLIAKEEEPDAGQIRLRGHIAVITQLAGQDADTKSGGEATQQRIDEALYQNPDLLLADEPTCNLDIDAIRSLEARLRGFNGALLLVSHDRALLQAVCDKVFDIKTGTLYGCGYLDYVAQKKIEEASKAARYEAYAAEKSRLKKVAEEKARQSARVKNVPRRMGNSEARLHKMGGQSAKAKLDSACKAARTRLNQLEKVEKPYAEKEIVFDLRGETLHSDVLVSISGVSKAYGSKTVLRDCSFAVPRGKKTALIGANGAGKTTLLDLIASGGTGIHQCARLNIGYFKQDISLLDLDKNLLQNAMEGCVYNECFARTILARLHFWRDTLGKKAGVLSGGERIKLALACIMLRGFNLLMLDEPTNYLDVISRNALESVLCAYPGTVLFASHDRALLEAVADRIVLIENGAAHTFEGGWHAYQQAHG